MRALVCTRTSVQEADLNCLLELTVLRDNAFSEVLASYQENTGCCTTYLNQRYQDRGTLEHRITWQGGGSVWAIKAVGDPIWKVQASEVKNLHTIPRTTTTSRHGSNEIKQEQKVRWVSGKKKSWRVRINIRNYSSGKQWKCFCVGILWETGHTTNKCTAGKNQTMARKWIKRVSKTISRSDFCEEETMTSPLDLWCYH